MAKRIVKMEVDYLDSMIQHIRLLNGWSDKQVMDFFSLPKKKAIENALDGIQRTVNKAAGRAID